MPDTDYEKIDRYINNEMVGEEFASFEKAMLSTPELLEKVDLYRSIERDMRSVSANTEHEEKLRTTMANFNERYFTNATKNSPKIIKLNLWKKWYSVAAMIILVAGMMTMYILSINKPISASTLYAQYSQHSPISFQRGLTSNQSLLDAVRAYNKKEYSIALPYFYDYISKDSSDAEILMATAICELEGNNYEKALAGFSKVEENFEVFKYKAIWYKALTFLKQDDLEQCKNVLRQIPPESEIYDKAEDLLRNLKAVN